MRPAALQISSFYVFLAYFVSVSLPVPGFSPLIAQTQASALDTQNHHPLIQGYAIARADLLDRRHQAPGWFAEVQHVIYNSSYEETGGDESILIDGELNRSDLKLGYRWNASDSANHSKTSHSLGVTLPWISHSGGRSDSMISNWHKAFGLPNSNRDNRPDDQLSYIYEVNGDLVVDQQNAAAGVGDIELQWTSTHHQSHKNYMHSWSTGLHVPSGDEEKLLGSGTTDFFLQWQASYPIGRSDSQLYGFAGLGLAYSVGDGLLHDRLKRRRTFGHAGLAWQTRSQFELIAQLTSQSATYESDLDSLNRSLQLSIGLRTQMATPFNAELFFTEDLEVSAAPDFGLGFKLIYRPIRP